MLPAGCPMAPSYLGFPSAGPDTFPRVIIFGRNSTGAALDCVVEGLSGDVASFLYWDTGQA
jgi:hypothetical protein